MLLQVAGPAAALDLVDQLPLDRYQPFHASRADLLRRLDRIDEAATAYRRAVELTASPAEREHLAWQASDLRPD